MVENSLLTSSHAKSKVSNKTAHSITVTDSLTLGDTSKLCRSHVNSGLLFRYCVLFLVGLVWLANTVQWFTFHI